ncbi:MAG: Fe-S protein assembly co-chaperone HscB [Burkholderiales bacterium]|jgi:molecular chaperone HscB|nr:Fe-S protein assembly co-chaperone HscB [Burkholderiales bacterium]
MRDYYALFSLPRRYTVEREALTAAYHRAQTIAHPDQTAFADEESKRRAINESALINEAYHVLKNPVSRVRHLLQIHGADLAQGRLSVSFLEEQLDAREAAENALQNGDQTRLNDLLNALRRASLQRQIRLAALLDDEHISREALRQAQNIALELQFLERFADDLDEKSGL